MASVFHSARRCGRCLSGGRAGVRGFTLIELMITLALVGILALGIMPFSELIVQRQKEQELRVALREIRTALDAFKEASDFGNIERQPDASGYPPTLSLLVAGVKDAKDPNGAMMYFLRRVPADPFFTGDPATPSEEQWNTRAYASPPDDPQGGADVFDVTSKSEGVGMNGIPYKQW
ncbi:general secretion pathway protein GspG [Pandoraea terrae]|uniref:General secretion pathway protein GspG n=1 Tax=Pandoraea terrae TaxID=1537710 RepID=A0A5E4SME7_9BURK|nr:type II secretion system protein [Pandoraea terrae]VVD77046.1 general secretion pathway protein GspG [Pandoraea terrae]